MTAVKKKRAAGPGRPPGRKNNATLDKERRIRREMAKAQDELSLEQIESMDAVDTMQFVMRHYLRAANYAGAASIARDLASFQRPKISSTTADVPLPSDMEADPIPTPDEEGPENPIL